LADGSSQELKVEDFDFSFHSLVQMKLEGED